MSAFASREKPPSNQLCLDRWEQQGKDVKEYLPLRVEWDVPKELQFEYAKGDDAARRLEVATKTDYPEILEYLSHDNDEDVLSEVIKRSPGVITDGHVLFEIHDRLSRDRRLEMVVAYVTRFHSILRRQAKESGDYLTLQFVAGNENTPPDALAWLVRYRRGLTGVGLDAGKNMNTPARSLYALLNDEDPEVVSAARDTLRKKEEKDITINFQQSI